MKAEVADMTNEINVSRVISLFGMPLKYHFVSPHYEDTPGKACRRCAKKILTLTYRSEGFSEAEAT